MGWLPGRCGLCIDGQSCFQEAGYLPGNLRAFRSLIYHSLKANYHKIRETAIYFKWNILKNFFLWKISKSRDQYSEPPRSHLQVFHFICSVLVAQDLRGAWGKVLFAGKLVLPISCLLYAARNCSPHTVCLPILVVPLWSLCRIPTAESLLNLGVLGSCKECVWVGGGQLLGPSTSIYLLSFLAA